MQLKWNGTGLALAAVGVIGLGLLTIPLSSAGAAPALPPVEAEALVTSVLSAKPEAFAGTITVDNKLGLPPLPGIPQAANGASTARVAADGQGKARAALPAPAGERVAVDDGTTLWLWNSADRTVTKGPRDGGAKPPTSALPGGSDPIADPAAAAKRLVSAARAFSTVSVDGTSEVAGRAAYDLVLAPQPSERTLLREVRIAVDAEKRLPLRLTVLAHGSGDPVLRIGFTELTFGPQDAAQFRFEPPPGATVRERSAGGSPGGVPDSGQLPRPTVVGEGWDTVLVSKLPAELAGGGDAGQLLSRLGRPISGTWGNGRLITTAVAAAIITDDGRVAVGAVPEQVLGEALAR